MIVERISDSVSIHVIRNAKVALYTVVDRDSGDFEHFTSARDARDFALGQVDLVDGLNALCC